MKIWDIHHTFTNLIYVILYTLPETNSKNTWKSMVGRWDFLLGEIYFQGRLLLVSGGVDSIDTRPRWSLVWILLIPHSWAAGHGKKFVWCTLWSWKIWKPSPRHRLGWGMESSGFATSKYRGTMEHTASYIPCWVSMFLCWWIDTNQFAILESPNWPHWSYFLHHFFFKSDLTNTRIFFSGEFYCCFWEGYKSLHLRLHTSVVRSLIEARTFLWFLKEIPGTLVELVFDALWLLIWVGCNRGKWRFSLGSPTPKSRIIPVVIFYCTGQGDNPTINY